MTDLLTRTPTAPTHEPVPTDLDAPASGLVNTVACDLALVVAPSTGRFRATEHGDELGAGALIGHVTGGKGRADEVRLAAPGRLERLLIRPGQLVYRGQPLAWIRRTHPLEEAA